MNPHGADHRTPVDLVLIGFGHVGQRFVTLLQELGPRIDQLVDWRVTGIATRRHGLVFDPDGIDPGDALGIVTRGERLDRMPSTAEDRPAGDRPAGAPVPLLPLHLHLPPRDALELIGRACSKRRRTVVVETTVLDIAAGQPALDHVRAALAAGADVITANKGPVAFAYEELRALAQASSVDFRFEGAVMDGIPVFNFVRDTLPAVTVRGFRGVINTTTNHILVAMEQGRPFSAALADMQAAGIAEADASLDIDGWDAAAKVAALANVWLDARITPHDVARRGISQVTAEDVRRAVNQGYRLKLVGSARRYEGRVEAVVQPVELPVCDPLAALDGDQNALILDTDILGEIGISQLSSGLTQTAYALVSDLLSLVQAQ